jgi:hypothetical protein
LKPNNVEQFVSITNINAKGSTAADQNNLRMFKAIVALRNKILVLEKQMYK